MLVVADGVEGSVETTHIILATFMDFFYISISNLYYSFSLHHHFYGNLED